MRQCAFPVVIILRGKYNQLMEDAELKAILDKEMARLKARLSAAEADIRQFKAELKHKQKKLDKQSSPSVK